MASQSAKRLIFTIGILGAIGVGLGAFAAHGLEDWLVGRGLAEEVVAKRLGQADTAVRYHMVHVVALLGLVGIQSRLCSKMFSYAAWGMVAGVLLFSGSLYILVATNTPGWGMVTPIGGVAWIVAWVLVALAARHGGESCPTS